MWPRLCRIWLRVVLQPVLAFSMVLALQGPAVAKRITIAATHTAILIYIAQGRGYFREQGLDVEIQTVQTGAASLNAVITGEAEFGSSAETPFVVQSFEHSDLRILATISAVDTMRLLARADRGINTPRDLAGKRIGVTLGSVGEYFLERYLLVNGVPITAATLIDLKPENTVEQITSGNIDAVMTWEPFVAAAELSLKDNVISMPEQYDQIYYMMLVGKQEWFKTYPEETRSLLRALVAAETYAAEHPNEAKELIRGLFGIATDDIDHLWSLHNLYVSLPQALMSALDQQAEWRLRQKSTAAAKIPNYLNFIDTSPLLELRSVGIVK